MIGWTFLVLSVIGALFTLNAYHPVRRNRLLSPVGFVASWLTTEGALVHVAWQALATLLFVAAGATEVLAGWVGLGITAASWVGLVVLYLQARGTTAVVSGTLAELVGADDDDSSAARRRRRVRPVRGVEFARVGGRRLCLDVFEPPHGGERRPAIVQIHGGAWVMGLKQRQGIPLLRYMAARGWVGFNVDYRLSPVATWPEHLEDVKRAITWVRSHAADYGVDPEFIAVTGGSAGGHLAAMAALTQNDPRYQRAFPEADTSVAAAVPFYGVYDLTNRHGRYPAEMHRWLLEPLVMKAFYEDEPELFAGASPLLVAENMTEEQAAALPPILLVHGDRDTLTPVADARELARVLREVSPSPVGYIELRGAQHAFDTFASPRTRRVIRGVYDFLAHAHRMHTTNSGAQRHSASTRVAPPVV